MRGKQPPGERARDGTIARSSTTREDPRALLATCVAAAVRAAEVIRHAAADLKAVHWELKGPADFVSAVDRGAEEALGQVITERHPSAVLMAEEGSPEAIAGDLTFV